MKTRHTLHHFFSFSFLIFSLFFLSAPGSQLKAQANVVVNTIVRPPYGNMLFYYAEQTRVIVNSHNSMRVYLSVHIKGDNGVDLITNPNYTGVPVAITANVMNQIGGSELSGYFEPYNLISNGIPIDEIINKGLPEGRYQICVRLKGPDGNFLSPDEPVGCSNFFNIRYGEPPMTINPQCGSVLDQSSIQYVMFSWTPATNASIWTQYTLKIVELLDSTQNPNEAMQTATDPPFFETKMYGKFSFLYGPAQPKLEKGRIYAWQVIAEDGETQAKFANNGKSPVCWFKWAPFEKPIYEVHEGKKDMATKAEIASISNNYTVPISTVSGKLNYKFKGAAEELYQGYSYGGGSKKNQKNMNFQIAEKSYSQISGPATVTGITQVKRKEIDYNQNNISTIDSKPLANVKLSLVVCYVLKGNFGNKYLDGEVFDTDLFMREKDAFMESYPDHEKVLATTTTSSDGSFSFMFMNTDEDLGLIDGDIYWSSGTADFKETITGEFYKVLRLKVENKYYCSPDINIKLEPWQSLDIGTVVSYVKSYNLKIHTQWTTATFWDVKGGQGKDLDNVKTTMVRHSPVNHIPRDEINYPSSENLPPADVLPKYIKTGYTNGDGIVYFQNLVQHDPDNLWDKYYILCEPDRTKGLYIFKKKEKSYYPLYLKDKKEFPFNSKGYENLGSGTVDTEYNAYGENITWNSQLKVKTYEYDIELYPDSPRVIGKVEAAQVGAKPMSNINLLMLNSYSRSSDYNKPQLTATTDAKGYYEFNKLDPELGDFNREGPTEVTGPKRFLYCYPSGFKGDARNLGILIWGQQEVQNFQLEPDGLLCGYVIDDRGNAVAANVQVDDLAFASTELQFEYGQPSTGTGTTPFSLPQSNINPWEGSLTGKPLSTTGVSTAGPTTGTEKGGVAGSFTETSKGGIAASVTETSKGGIAASVAESQKGDLAKNMTGGTVKGSILDGEISVSGVKTYLLENGEFTSLTYNNPSSLLNITGSKQVFSIKAPSGKARKITIIPKDPGFSTETYTVDVPKAKSSGEPELQPYIVYRMQKRVRFIVAEAPGTPFNITGQLKAVPDAEVTLKIPGKEITRITDGRGTVVFEFENNATSFTFNIKAPEDSDLEDAVYTLNNVKDSKTEVVYPPALLKKATSIYGKVNLASGNMPLIGLEEATVYIETGNGKRIETKTNEQGSYTLKKIPKHPANVTVWASKPEAVPNIISQSKQITLKEANLLDFTLYDENEIAIEDIYGFKADIKKKEKQSDGSYLVSGSLINLPANPNFKTAEENQTIPFVNLKIRDSGKKNAKGIPIGVPAVADFDTDLKELRFILNDAWGILQSPSTGSLIKISSVNNKGRINGKAGILKNSFQYSDNYLYFKENIPLYLVQQPGGTQTSITTITADDYPLKKWGLTSASGGDIQFKFLNFSAKGDRLKSWLENDRIGLATVLTTNDIQGMIPSRLNISVGELILRPTKIDAVSSNNPLKFKLEKWDFEGSAWSIQQNSKGVYIPHGTIKTGIIDVPAKNIMITPDNFTAEKFEINNLTFSGVTPLNILTDNISFGYNPATGSDRKPHWELRIIGSGGNPGVSISGLPGMEAGSEMRFQSFSLISNGEQQINMGNQKQQLVFHKVLKVSPLSFSGGDKYFEMSCNIDLDIPRIKPGSAVIRFSKPANQILFTLYPFNVSFEGPGGVRFVSGIAQGDQKLEASGFTAIGTIKDKEGINLKGTLHRTVNAAWLEVDPKGQTMPLGSGQTYLKDIVGKMEVLPSINDWSKFTFSGEMTGFKGMESNLRKTFTVHGSITADNESLGVKNIPLPFGGMDLSYDIRNARLTGNIDIDQKMGALHVKGAANIVIDAAGWYFLMGGQLTAPGFGNMSTGMLLGDYRMMAPDVVQTLMQFAYNKKVPSAFSSGVSGFFITGQKDVPIINIPDFEINLGILYASLGLSAGLDGRLWMGFDGSGSEFGIGAMAFVHAWFKASSITCTKLSAEARVELGATGVYQTNTGTFTAEGCGSFSIRGSAGQCFPVPCLKAICCEGCISGSVSESVKLDLLFDSKGNTSMNFGFGSCSGQGN